ncbi:MAG: hypothetical protein R6T98_11230 [Desulfatiglandales bacterium]
MPGYIIKILAKDLKHARRFTGMLACRMFSRKFEIFNDQHCMARFPKMANIAYKNIFLIVLLIKLVVYRIKITLNIN